MKTKRRHIRRARTFMGRVVGLLAITLALYALFATTTYGLLSRTTFNNIKANELLPKLEKITDLIEHSLPDEECDSETGIAASDMKSLSLLKQLDPDLLDAYLLIVNSAGDSLYNNVMPDDVTPGMTLGTNLEKVIAGESVIFTLSMPAWRIDALAVGITLALLPGVNIAAAVLFIGCITFILSAVGLKVGNVFGLKYKNKAEMVGGAILILMGLKILLEHLGVIQF